MDWRIRGGLRGKIFLAHLLVIAVGMVTLFVATLSIAPTLFDRLMGGMMGPGASSAGGMMTGMAETTTQAFRSAMLQALLLSAGAATLAAVVVSLFVSTRIVTPIQRLLAASGRIASGHYAERVPATDPDELGALAAQFNTMASRLGGGRAAAGGADRQRGARAAHAAGDDRGLHRRAARRRGCAEPATWALLHDEAGRLRRLVQELQELSRAEARQLPLQLRPCPPAELVDQAVRRIAPQFAEKGVTLTTDIPADLPPVQADADRIIQVLINLLGNALRYTPAGGRVQMRAERQQDAVTFHVVDTRHRHRAGASTAPVRALLPRRQGPLARARRQRDRANDRRAIVEAHDGQIWAASNGPGQGATFSFMIPIAP